VSVDAIDYSRELQIHTIGISEGMYIPFLGLYGFSPELQVQGSGEERGNMKDADFENSVKKHP
jgi:hypothetical protein